MKTFRFNIFRGLGAIVLAIATLFAFDAKGFPTSIYAPSSAMAEGNWVKIKVNGAGMHFISNSQLSTMGFSDPSKVNVYGFGGRMISETLTADMPDDLPLLPVVRTATGIVFFGVNYISWDPALSLTNYTHTMHPYGEFSYYFLSDRASDAKAMEEIDLRETQGLLKADSFIDRLVHENDIYAPANTGRTLLGEDLRAQLQLNFPLTDNVGGDASIVMVVGSNISNSNGTIRLTSSNAQLDINSATIDALRSSDQYYRTNTVRFGATSCGEALNLGLNFSSGGVINMVRLDYVEVEYERGLRLPDDQLYFYYNESEPLEASLSGVTGETEIWDVTKGHAPRKVIFSVEGNKAKFRIDSGYHEFVAFNPSKVARQVENAGSVETQNIHGMPSPDMIIISPAEFIRSAEKIAELHRTLHNMTVYVFTPELIYNEFSSGTPDVSAFRKAMKMWYDRDMETTGSQKLKYCLLMSRATYDNKQKTQTVAAAGYPRIPIWQSPTGFSGNSSYSTDDFIGMLEDNDMNYAMGARKINVAVGRFPVRTPEEAATAADKLVAYTLDPGKASWRNNVMMIADDQDDGAHLDQTEKMYASMIASNKGKDYQYERLYLDNFERKLTSVGLEYPEAKKRLLSKFEEGQALVTYVGHANTVSWTHEHLLNWGDITSFSNTRLPVLYAATCEFLRIDDDEYSGGEVMWAFPKTGVISMISPSRSVYINMNGPVSAHFGKHALTLKEDGSPITIGEAYINTKNGISGNDDNKLRYVLIGDPAMRMPAYSLSVKTNEIYGVDITDPEAEAPTIEARSNPVLKGEITDHNGEKVTDFNGFVYLKLYDAEKVVETLGNGDNGRVMIYNDRTTKLFDGAAKVENGEWTTTIYMPSEIENNFTPGRITFYALSDDGREANGATDNFYIYGYDANAPEDNKGPEIKRFVLNHDNFKDWDLTYKTPVVYATFFDESGINLSDAGIGHALMLTLDDKIVYSDVMNFYSPDLYDNRQGSFTYQLPEIEAGKHSLTLSVWDCANNSSYSTLYFNVAAVKDPDIYDISTSFNADRSGVEFIISSDRPLASLACELEVYDINGIRIWHTSTDDRTDASSAIKLSWDFTTAAGNRVNKGIYICRATVVTPEGKMAKKSKKIVVSQ